MSIILLNWGGNINTSPTVASPIEIWSNSLAVTHAGSMDLTLATALHDDVVDYWVASKTWIDPRVTIEWIKVNEFDINPPFHQITDPTNEWTGIGSRGAGDEANNAITTSCRVSIDNGTRNPRARGGWFVPLPTPAIYTDFRFTGPLINGLADTAEDFLNAVNAHAGCNAAVWSRREAGAFVVTRCRVGDVPDNISRRKNALHEVRTQRTIP